MTPAKPDLGVTYDRGFYEGLDGDVSGSAAAVVPVVCDLVHPASVLDVGCGRGTWLAAFTRAGVGDVMGVDGPHVPRADLEIPPGAFLAHDLTQPLRLGRRFDLVVSLEVAEHLDAEVAPPFVESLVAHAAVVLFSAAIPGQGGAGHVNEQWPSYWAAHFAPHGYVAVDAVRPALWTDARVSYWYAQNTLLFVDAADETTASLRAAGSTGPLDLVHPAMFERRASERRAAPAPSLSRTLRDLPSAARRAVRHRIGHQ